MGCATKQAYNNGRPPGIVLDPPAQQPVKIVYRPVYTGPVYPNYGSVDYFAAQRLSRDIWVQNALNIGRDYDESIERRRMQRNWDDLNENLRQIKNSIPWSYRYY